MKIHTGFREHNNREGLYPHLLGRDWESLASPIRDFHSTETPIQGEGVFRVVRGPDYLGRFISWMAGFPRSGEQVKTRLRVDSEGDEEIWHRVFDGKNFISRQQSRDGLLCERFGPFELGIRLISENNRLFYFSEQTCFVLGSFRLKIPKWLGLQAKGCESVLPEGDRLFIEMEASSKLFGRILSYQGKILWWREK